MLAVAVNPNYEIEAKFEGEFVPRLDTSPKAEMMGEREDVGAGRLRCVAGSIAGAIIDNENRNAWEC